MTGGSLCFPRFEESGNRADLWNSSKSQQKRFSSDCLQSEGAVEPRFVTPQSVHSRCWDRESTAGEVGSGLGRTRDLIFDRLGMKVDLSVVKRCGEFDKSPYLNVRRDVTSSTHERCWIFVLQDQSSVIAALAKYLEFGTTVRMAE